MSVGQGSSFGWNSQPEQQHQSQGQGSGGDAQAATVAALQGAQGAPQQQPNGQGGGSQGQSAQQPQGGVQGLADGFLGNVTDPSHKAILEPYVRQWDAGVTRRFQDLHGQLTPYQELGADPEELGQAMQIYRMIDEQPERVLELLQEALGNEGEQQPIPGQQPPGQSVQGGSEGTPGLPPEVQSQLELMQTVLENLAERTLQQDRSAAEQAEDAELDEHFELLKQEFGDFDEDYVVAKMLAGMDGAQAVQAYQQTVQGGVNSASRSTRTPPILSGGGAIPQEGQRLADASRKDIKSLVANILSNNS